MRGTPNPISKRDQLLDALSERFYVDERGSLVTNGLSTELIAFPSDLQPRRRKHLNELIDNAMNYATNFVDIDELNAIFKMPIGEKEPNYYAALGLYLYFADECSRLHPETTFLSELRKVKAGLKYGEEYTSDQLHDRFIKVLEHLGMDTSHGPLVREWELTGQYTIQGEKNGFIGNQLQGAYARLARDVCKQQKYLGMNLPVSYALGNKDHIAGKSAEEAYAFTQSLTNPLYTRAAPHVTSCIRQGNAVRTQRIRDAIAAAVPDVPDMSTASAKRTGKDILKHLPESMLELLYREGYVIAYAQDATIGKCYPGQPLPGINAGDVVKSNKGLREARYRTIFISNGKPLPGRDLDADPELRSKVAAQTLAHETFHCAVDYLNDKEVASLQKAAEAVRGEIVARKQAGTLPDYFSESLQTIIPRTLEKILDYTYELYDYARPLAKDKNGKDAVQYDNRWLEVACNAYSLMQTEFPPNAQSPNPYSDLESIGRLRDEVQKVEQKALLRCRTKYSYVDMPLQKPAQHLG